MQEPLISICIPSYNRIDYLKKCIPLFLSVEEIEICIHDDGSDDGTKEYLSSINNKRLKYTSGQNRGLGYARSKSMILAKGEYIMPFDSDDLMTLKDLLLVIENMEGSKFDWYCFDLMDSSTGNLLGTNLANNILTRYTSLRGKYHVKGDKRDVIRRDLLTKVLIIDTGPYRLVPMSLYFHKLQKYTLVYYQPIIVGKKVYLDSGMSKNVRRLVNRIEFFMALDTYYSLINKLKNLDYSNLIADTLRLNYYLLLSFWAILTNKDKKNYIYEFFKKK